MEKRGKWFSLILFSSVIFMLTSMSSTLAHADTFTFGFDHHPILINESSGITYYDSNTVGDGVIRTIQVQITAPCYTDSILTELSEDVTDDGYYYSPKITFITATNCPGISPPSGVLSSDFNLEVTAGQIIDIVTTDPPLITDYVDIVTTSGSLQWSPKRTNNNYVVCGNDADNDGICNGWEDPQTGLTISYPSGGPKLNYPCNPECPSKTIPDIYLELDWMQGHPPSDLAIQDIKDAFAQNGVTLHVYKSEEIPHQDELAFGGANHPRLFGFDQVKAYYFGDPDERNDPSWDSNGWKKKKQIFHYGIYAHSQKGSPTSSGAAELNGNDWMITFGGWPGNIPARLYE